jgi:hypothetical protein
MVQSNTGAIMLTVGDKCYCSFVLSTVDTIKDGKITGIETEFYRTSGSDLRCFPVTDKVARISNICKAKSDAFHGLCFNGLNHPDLNRELERRWIQLCESDSDERLEILLESLDLFTQHIVNTVEYIRTLNVDGINIVRR